MSIASMVLQTRPELAARVERRVTALAGAEVHTVTGDGRLVVVVDHPDDGEAGALVQSLQDMEDVLSASLIYVHFDNDPDEDTPS